MKPEPKPPPEDLKAWCAFCGSTVGQIDCRTGRRVKAVYHCPRCRCDYCDQCSGGGTVAGARVQLDGPLECRDGLVVLLQPVVAEPPQVVDLLQVRVEPLGLHEGVQSPEKLKELDIA